MYLYHNVKMLSSYFYCHSSNISYPIHLRYHKKKCPIEFASIKHEIQMKPLPIPPLVRSGDARAQIAARAAFRHIFTRRGAHSTRFS